LFYRWLTARMPEVADGASLAKERVVPLIRNDSLPICVASLPVASFQIDEPVFLAGSRTGRLLILKKGAVVVIKEGFEIARVSEPGAVFGELSILLDQPHTADVRTLEPSEFYVANEELLAIDQLACIYVATVLAGRVDNANQAVIELKRQLHAIERNLVHPFNPLSRH
jgi:CRP/FNR family transcriptional regulator, cyclic AMP receptor protein